MAKVGLLLLPLLLLLQVGPSEAAKVVGWRSQEVAGAGQEVLGVATEARAREVVSWREQQKLKYQVKCSYKMPLFTCRLNF